MFSNQIAFNGMIPLKNYKGPILKLTNSETERIAALQKNINNMEIELYQLNKIFEGKRLTTIQGELKQIIRDIKINRLNAQKNG